MELGEDFQPHEGGLIDDQHGDLLSLGDFQDGGTQGFGKPGKGVGPSTSKPLQICLKMSAMESVEATTETTLY